MAAEDPAVVGHRADEQDRGRGRRQQADPVEVPLPGIEAGEAHREGQGQEEPEEHLHPESRHPQLLEQVAHVPVVPLSLRAAPWAKPIPGRGPGPVVPRWWR